MWFRTFPATHRGARCAHLWLRSIKPQAAMCWRSWMRRASTCPTTPADTDSPSTVQRRGFASPCDSTVFGFPPSHTIECKPYETSRRGGCARHASCGLLAGSDGTQPISRKNHVGRALNIHREAIPRSQALGRAQAVQHRAVRTHRRRIRKPTRPVADVQIQYRADAQPQPLHEGSQPGHTTPLVTPEMKLLVDLDDPVHVGRRKPPLCAKRLLQLR